MKIKTLWTAWMFSFAFGQIETNSYEVRKIRLENFKNNYKGKSIRFTDENSRVVYGVLVEITESDFVISINNESSFFSHKNISTVYIPPTPQDFYMVLGMSIFDDLNLGLFDQIIGKRNSVPVDRIIFLQHRVAFI